MKKSLCITACACALIAGCADSPIHYEEPAARTLAEARFTTGPSLSVLEFAGADTLFGASNTNGTIYAYTLSQGDIGTPPQSSMPYNFEDFGTQLSRFLNVDALDITYNDLAVNPVSTAAFLSLTIQTPNGPKPALVRVSQDGDFALIDTTALDSTSVELSETPAEDVVFWRDIPATSLTVTDIEYTDGRLFVAGLSTGEFASTLRQFDYPFVGAERASTIEIYHAAHNQNETRAPIRAMAMVPIGGELSLVAAYTCTPLVTISAERLQDGAHIVGKTVAELGYGNVPLEVLPVTAMNMQGQPEDFVLVINREMSANLIRMEDLARSSAAPGITTPIAALGDTAGVENTRHPMGGVIQADNQDPQFLLVLRRNADTGEIELISQMKGAYFRLSDFVSEYNFPDYSYSQDQAGTEQFHNIVKPMEGYPELATQQDLQ